MAPHAHKLSKRTRTLTFLALVVVFLVSTPLVSFYARGYRIVRPDGATSTTSAIVQTGGLYIGVTTLDTIFVDDTIERGSRLFSSARYIDGVSSGMHRVHVQREGAHTWVKVLPVSHKLVTEAYAFNLGTTTTARLITPSLDTAGKELLRASSTIALTTTNDYRVDKTARAYPNDEYAALLKLFSSEGATTTNASGTVRRAQERVIALRDLIEGAAPATTTDDVIAVHGDLDVLRRGDEIVVRYSGSRVKMPYYFCVDDTQSTTTPCVPEIRMDRQGQAVRDALFYPSTQFDALLIMRADGIFVTEIDPRGGWQNTQPLVKGADLSVRVDGAHIYIKDDAAIYEVVTTQ